MWTKLNFLFIATTRSFQKPHINIGWLTRLTSFVYLTGDIANELGVPPQTLTSLIRKHTTAVAIDKQCADCGRFYPLTSRSSFSERRPSRAWMCPDCIAAERQRSVEAKLNAKQIHRENISEIWDPNNRHARTLEEYSLMDVVSMLSMVRGGAAEDYSYIKPVNSFDEHLTPNTEFTVDILNYVFDRDLLTPHPGSRVDAFKFTDHRPTSFYLYKVNWVMPQWGNLRDITSMLEEIIARGELPSSWKESIPEVWQSIVLQEGTELLEHYVTEHKFSLQVGEKTVDVLASILRHYSVAQLQNFLWRAARDAAAYYVRENIPKARAANSIVTRLQGNYERARASAWEIKPYSRLFNLPQSLISKVFFNSIMQMPDSYRTSLPPDDT